MAADERKDMRSEYVVAAVSVVIALLGIMGTLMVTAREENAEAARAQEEFVREQRRDAYAALLSTEVEHHEERDRFVDAVVDAPEGPGIVHPEGYAAYSLTYDKLVLAIHTVQMMGSDPLVEALDEVQASHDAVHEVVVEAMRLLHRGEAGALAASTVHETLQGGFEDQLRPLDAARATFISLARADLGLAG